MPSLSAISFATGPDPAGDGQRWDQQQRKDNYRRVGPALTPSTISYRSPDFPEDGTPPPAAGRGVTIVLRSDSPEVTEFVWSADLGETEQVVVADRDGNATVHYTTPFWTMYLEIQARARTTDGFESSTTYRGWDMTPADTPSP